MVGKKKKTCKEDVTSLFGIFKQRINAGQSKQRCLAQSKCSNTLAVAIVPGIAVAVHGGVGEAGGLSGST